MATKIYTNQPLQLTLDCKRDVTAATALSIKAQRPDGTMLTWSPATAVDTNFVRYQIPANVLNMHGDWKVQSIYTTVDGDTPGETALLQVYSAFS